VVGKHVTSIFAEFRLPASPDQHRRVLAFWRSYALTKSRIERPS
jgi:hypothetical protein